MEKLNLLRSLYYSRRGQIKAIRTEKREKITLPEIKRGKGLSERQTIGCKYSELCSFKKDNNVGFKKDNNVACCWTPAFVGCWRD